MANEEYWGPLKKTQWRAMEEAGKELLRSVKLVVLPPLALLLGASLIEPHTTLGMTNGLLCILVLVVWYGLRKLTARLDESLMYLVQIERYLRHSFVHSIPGATGVKWVHYQQGTRKWNEMTVLGPDDPPHLVDPRGPDGGGPG